MSIGGAPQISNYPFGFNNGVSIRGMPVFNMYSGNVIWVDSTSGADGNRPGNFMQPVATVMGALAFASAGDTIVCKQGHAESVTSAGAITMATAGINIIGLGGGRRRPTFTFSGSTAATLLVTAANCSIVNCVFDLTGIDALVAPIGVQASDFYFGCNEVITASATNQATLGILTTAAADRFVIDECNFFGTSNAGTTAAVRLVGGTGIQITNSTFFGSYTTTIGAIENLTTACVNLMINNCFISNNTAASTKAIVAVAATTGQISNCRMQILSGTAPITGAAMSWVGGNYYAATIATLGTLI